MTGAHDWVILAMCCPGTIDAIEVDTSWFKGNFPHTFTIEGAHVKTLSGAGDDEGKADDIDSSLSGGDQALTAKGKYEWTTILSRRSGMYNMLTMQLTGFGIGLCDVL